jgi:hypothetical protein
MCSDRDVRRPLWIRDPQLSSELPVYSSFSFSNNAGLADGDKYFFDEKNPESTDWVGFGGVLVDLVVWN